MLKIAAFWFEEIGKGKTERREYGFTQSSTRKYGLNVFHCRFIKSSIPLKLLNQGKPNLVSWSV